MKATKLLAILKTKLGYKVVPKRGKGSHTVYVSQEYRRITWAFHNKRNLAPREVRNVLVRQVGLTIQEAKEVLNVD